MEVGINYHACIAIIPCTHVYKVLLQKLNILFFIGSRASAPSQLSRVCARRSEGGVNISWDALPCHRQNGADITSYVIRHSSSRSISTDINLSSSKSNLLRFYRSGANRYDYQIPLSTFLDGVVTYTFQVSARNSHGLGPFSTSVKYTVSYTSTGERLNFNRS